MLIENAATRDMSKGILYICCGAPGSGKTTFLNDMAEPTERVVSRDNIRFSLVKEGETYFKCENKVFSIFCDTITKYINSGINVYADATHLNQKSRYKLLYRLKSKGARPREINAIYFNVPLKVCLERNELRRGTRAYVPIDRVEEMYCNYVPPTAYEGFTNIWEVDEDGDVNIVKEG